jgi:superfamily I DNA/RNA helicase
MATLSAEQLLVVDASPQAQMLVTAGPGTGKTYTLIARLAHLVQTEGLSPGQEILVLSFSRAAVGLIRDRLVAAGGDVRFVRAVTFDSFATALLSEVRPDGPWVEESYDGRIRSATKLIAEDPEAKASVGQFRQVLIDEAQDLVGERAEFVKTILSAATGGFTVLGDPAQGIYGFQLRPEERRAAAGDFYRWIRQTFQAKLVERQLTVNYRAKTSAARAALWLGPELNSVTPDYGRISEQLRTLLLGLDSVGDVKTAGPLLRQQNVKTAVLCRTNGQVLLISRELYRLGIAHELQRAATDRVIAPWVALAFMGLEHERLGKGEFIRRISELQKSGQPTPDPEKAWRLIKRLDKRSTDDIDTAAMAARLRVGNLPDELTAHATAQLIVSTIHRAKGLEFSRVIIVDPGFENDPEDLAEEARILFVAFTRPSEELFYMKAPNSRGVYCPHNGEDRWVRRRTQWMTNDVEVKGDDSDSTHPAGSLFVHDVQPGTVQEYIRKTVKTGDSVTLWMAKESQNGQPRVSYAIEHEGQVVGVTSDYFGGSLFRTLKISPTWRVNWPLRIDDLHVEAIDSVAGSPVQSHRSGLGVSGLWLRVRVAGFGDLIFENSHNR